MTKKNRSKQKRSQSFLFLLIYSFIQLLPVLLIWIGDTVILLLMVILIFCKGLLKFIYVSFKKILLSVKKFTIILQKRILKLRHKRQGIVFSYHNYERVVIRERKRQTIFVSLFAKLRYLTAGIILSFFFIFLPLVAIIFIQDLPSPNQLSLNQVPQTTKIYDRNGVLLYQLFAQQNRTLVPLNKVPVNLQHATIAIEDKNFYSHPGFDLPSIARAALADVSGKAIQGGSTITQQLIKSSLLTPQQNIIRKFKEVILAFWAERLYTKNQILEMYFNQVPYGGTAWGVEAASEVYFNENVQDLDLAQSAFLAGLTASPSTYSPFGNYPNLWKRRQLDVLEHMVELGYITKQQAVNAVNEQLNFVQHSPYYAPHFINYILDILEKKYGTAEVERGGLIVRTSLDINIQNMAQSIVSKEITNDAYLNLTNGAAVITSPQNGDILAMVGSHDFNDPNGGNVNLATSLRQPGSSIKVVTYSAAFQRGLTAATLIDDTPITFSNQWEIYSPVNYDGRFHGRVSIRTALANSFNIPAVKIVNQIGVPSMVAMGKQMGIDSWGDPSQYGLSITLGGADVTMLDMARVYGTLANEGTEVDLNPILKITDYKGTVLEEKLSTNITRNNVLDPGIAFILGDILADNNARQLEFGLNSPLAIPNYYVPVKTGTTDNKKDNWTDGYTKNFVVITWVGNNNNIPMSQNLASGITGAAPIWHQIMSNLLQIIPEQKLVPPNDVIKKSCNGHDEYFIRGTENSIPCNNNFPSITPIMKQ